MSGTIGSNSVLFWASRIARGHHAEHSGHGDGVVKAMEALEVESTHVGGCENRARRDKEQAEESDWSMHLLGLLSHSIDSF